MNLPVPSTERQSGRVLILSTSAFTLLFAAWLMFGVLGVSIKEEFHLDKIQFAWLTAIAILSGALWRLPAGILTDRFGGRRVLTALLLASAIPCALVATATSFRGLLIYAFLFGIAGNSFSVGIAWNAAWFKTERQGFALGIFGAGNVGASLTKFLGPPLIVLVGWRFVPVLYAALLVMMAALVWFRSPSPDRQPGSGRTVRSMLEPLREARVWRFGLYYVVVFGAYVALSLWLPNYYRSVYGLSLMQASLLTALFIFPASLLRPFGGWLSDRHGARIVTYSVFAAMLLATIPLAASRPGLGLFVVLIEVLAVGMGIGMASVCRYIPEYFPRDVGAAGGLVGTLGALGGFILPLAFGYLDQVTGKPQSCFWVMLALIAWSFLWLHLVVLGIRRRVALNLVPS